MLLSTAYCPPVAWCALAARDFTLSPDRVLPSRVQLEACENYRKQSYRNRCHVLSADGPQMLQVPVVHGTDMRITAVRVDYSTPWVLRTQRALDTAYETAAFYEYYRDGLFALLERQPEKLWELNLSIARWCLERCGIACELEATTTFAAPDSTADDYRYNLHPKMPCPISERPYYQVFRDRIGGFTPGLSILDLLFNEGPDSLSYLRG